MKSNVLNHSATSSHTTIILQSVFATILSFTAFFILGNTSASAATIPVTGSCTIAQAINSVNAGSNQGTCVGSGAYGTNDTITIPAGTHTLTANLPDITESVVIQGAGMGQTIVDGDGQYEVFRADSVDILIRGMKIQAYAGSAIQLENCNVELDEIEIDGQNADEGSNLGGIQLLNMDGNNRSIRTSNVYVHDITDTSSQLVAFSIQEYAGGVLDVETVNTTISNIHNPSGDVVAYGVAVQGDGQIEATLSNITISNITGLGVVGVFMALTLVSSGANAESIITVNNATISGLRGSSSANLRSAAFYGIAGAENLGDEAISRILVSNSLFMDNLNDGVSLNCSATDLSALMGGDGVGTVQITSLGHNISDDASCTSFTEPTDQQNVGNILSTLGPLQMNGGAVPIMALLPGSPAISAGGAFFGVATDARGVARPSSNTSVGAYQYVLADETETPAGGNAQNGAGQLSETGQGYALIALAILIVSAGAAVVIRRQRA